MKQYKAHISNEISQDEYFKNLTELQANVKKECEYDDDDDNGIFYTQKDLAYIEKEINKIKPNEPEKNISESPEIKQETPRTITPRTPKPKEKDRGIDR